MISPDYYATLGVSPDAEDIVIAAAYRALAQRYHPDKLKGDKNSHLKMAAINEAYGLLRDPTRRAEYDCSHQRSSGSGFEAQDDADQSGAFSDAMNKVDDRWQIAKSVYPDIESMRVRLGRFSLQLAFAYVTTVLERKDFERHREIAVQLESNFLSKYFGSNDQVVTYARDLILSGHRDAARALNRLIDVLGSPENAQPYIEKIERDFKLQETRETRAANDADLRRLLQLSRLVREFGYYDEAKELATLKGFSIEEFGFGMFKNTKVRSRTPAGKAVTFDDVPQFVRWVQSALCT